MGGRFRSSPISTDRYLLACSRYMEMNLVREGMVERPEDYRYSSYAARIGLRKIEWLDYDTAYLALGKKENERQKGCKEWVQGSISKYEWNSIRESIQRNWAYGNKRFKDENESVFGRRFKIRKPSRKPEI